MNIAPYVKTAKSVITANSPVLLLGTTIAGIVTTGVLAAKAGWNARGIVDEHKDSQDPLSPQEIAQLTWHCYTLPALSAAGSIAAAVGTHTIHTKRANAMAALYAVTSSKLDDMTDRAEKLLGPKKAQQLRDEVSQAQVDREPLKSDSEVIIIEDGAELCFDEFSGRYFTGSMQRIESAMNDFNRALIDEGDLSLNEFYDFLGLSRVPMGDDFGWSGEKVEVKFGSTLTKDGRPAISMSFRMAPKRL